MGANKKMEKFCIMPSNITWSFPVPGAKRNTYTQREPYKILFFYLVFESVYLRPFLTNFTFEILKDLLELITSRTLLAVDSNAKPLLWNSATIRGRTRREETMKDDQGEDLECFVLKHGR